MLPRAEESRLESSRSDAEQKSSVGLLDADETGNKLSDCHGDRGCFLCRLSYASREFPVDPASAHVTRHGYLALTVPIAASLLALLTFGGYLFLYTPLKRQTPICTFVGAFSGAMPVLIGYVAASGKLDFSAWLLFAILFLWQFSHFMAIAWMYREDYARAGYRVFPPGPEKSKLVEWQSVLPALALIPITVASLILQQANQLRVVATLLLSLSFLCFAARLAGIRSNGSARQLLLVSVVYLPLVFLLHVLARV